MIQEELTKMADEAEDDEDEQDSQKEEHDKPAGKKVEVWLVRDGMDWYCAFFGVHFLNYAFAIASVLSPHLCLCAHADHENHACRHICVFVT